MPLNQSNHYFSLNWYTCSSQGKKKSILKKKIITVQYKIL